MSWGVQCAGPPPTSLCFTGDGADGATPHLHLQAAVVTVDDPVAPAVASGLPGDGVRRTNEIFTAAATDSAGVRSLRVLVDGVARVDERYDCDYRLAAPCAGAALARLRPRRRADGRHTVTTIAEDAASNVTRTERTIDVDGTAPVDRPRPGQRAHGLRARLRRRLRRRGRDDRGARPAPTPRSPR